ncbi:guanine deaminase [Lepeophtheirus salmonis]|uniref:guanine deaminase n=1 Tax=Lepeophtheirus salmonis TaxID=72036 RepID=UPI001AE1872C|nr:guanine deaminase-like [Lepeophtheirus salmonis]XP_040574817.1 guanine deaminase-like [Lepeophtheirus salmonis]XP_040574818.1 guanine deaminase-like [Lepeophtheirus salmonis]
MTLYEHYGIRGTIIDVSDDRKLRIRENYLLVIESRSGSIVECQRATSDAIKSAKEKYSIEKVIELDSRNEFLLPGFIDTHIHASQFPNNGLGMDLPLIQWLNKYTFPVEARFSDVDFAKRTYNDVVDTTLSYGTTTAVYFATIHREASEILCDVAERMGQRAFVGKVNMNRNCPENYQETTQDSLNETNLFVHEILNRKSELVEPVVTPRFVPTCDKELLIGLGDIVSKTGVRVQSHISECKQEIQWVAELEKSSKHYADAYDCHGLLTERTIMAHGTYLTDTEIALFKERNAGIVHCPNSNNSIMSGCMDVKKFISKGIDKIGLGTDCSGGYSPSLINAMRFAMITNKNLMLTEYSNEYLTFEDALYFATRGSAKVACIADKVGVIDLGYKFDALIIEMSSKVNKATKLFGHESIKEIVHKFIYLGDDRNIKQVFVNGKCVKSTTDGDVI